MTRDFVLTVLRDARSTLRQRYRVESLSVFGSLARGEADEVSDVDVAVRFAKGAPSTAMRLCGVSGLLSGLLGRDVDVVALPARNQSLAASIRKEGVRAF
ncbi:MAG: nucleotidyltransferase family protein [Caulobacteraceae bacterium]